VKIIASNQQEADALQKVLCDVGRPFRSDNVLEYILMRRFIELPIEVDENEPSIKVQFPNALKEWENALEEWGEE